MSIANDTLVSILHGFAGVEKPTHFLQPNGLGSDEIDIKIFESIRHWENIPDEWIFSEYSALGVADAGSFQFLLPAYLSFSIRNVYSSAFAVDCTIYALNPSGDLAAFTENKYTHLSEGQRDAIRAFLRFLTFHQDEVDWSQAKQAINYWNLQ